MPRAILAVALALVPVGVEGQTQSLMDVAALAALGVRLEVNEEEFVLSGATLAQAREHLEVLGPLGPGGRRAHAITDFRLKPAWMPERLRDRCVVRGAGVDLEILIRLPRWEGEMRASAGERHEWAVFQRMLRAHEYAHRDATVQAALVLSLALREVEAPTCPRLTLRIGGLIRRAHAELRSSHAALDARELVARR